jgi:DNA-binding transcriptional regulator YhcF (GntR family)
MEKEFLKNQTQLTKEGYVIVSSYFLDYCVEILGTGPGMLYIQLLNYCHKGKDLAWPTLATLGKKMQFTPKTITKFHQILLKHGLIKKISKGKTASGNYKRNIYQVTPLHMVKNILSTGNIFPHIEEKITPNIGKKLPTNNTNLNNTNVTTTNREKDAVAAVDFKKLKEKGEERMRVIREQMVELDFKEEFIVKILKEYSTKKIDEKLDLLMERKNIKNPAGWLRAALKNDYHDREQERYDEEPLEQVSRQTPLSHLDSTPSMGEKFRETIVIDSHLSPEDRKIQSREKVLKMIKKTQKMLDNLKTKGGTNVRAKRINH